MEDKITTECWIDLKSWALPLRVTWWGGEAFSSLKIGAKPDILYHNLDVQFLCFGIRFERWLNEG
jgi:hypothetical protein